MHYAGTDVTFLGQDIHIGSFLGRPNTRTAIRELPTALNMYQVCRDVIGLYDGDGVLKTEDFIYLKDSGGTIKFAVGFRQGGYKSSYIDNNYYFICWKIADSNTTISENEKPPATAPYNNWHWCGESFVVNGYIANYPGIEPSMWPDLANAGLTPSQLLEQLALNSIQFWAPEVELWPYWLGPSYGDQTLAQMAGYTTSVFVIQDCELYNYDGTSIVTYTGETPISLHAGTAWSNMLNDYDATTPSYTIGSIGWGAQYEGYCPFDLMPVNPEEPIPDDPTAPGAGVGNYTPGGWGGFTGYDRKFPEKSVIDTGLIGIFNPSDAELQSFASYLWSDDYYTSLQKWGLKPTEQVIAFGWVPFIVEHENVSEELHLCGQGTNIQMYPVKSQYHLEQLGGVNIVGPNNSNAASFADFQRSKAVMYIPTVGFVPLIAADIIGKRVELEYKVDLFTGDTVANVYLVNSKSEVVLHHSYNTNTFINYPLTEANYAQYYQQKRHTVFGMLGDIAGGIADAAKSPANIGSSILNTISSIWDGMDNLTKLAPEVQRSGSMDGALAGICFEQPFILLYTPNPYAGNNYYKFYGFQTMNSYQLDTLGAGLTYVARVINNTVHATDREKNEIEMLLKDGVILPTPTP